MIYLTTFIFFTQAALAAAYRKKAAQHWIILISSAAASIYAYSLSRDSSLYNDAFINYGSSGLGQIPAEMGVIEPGFLLITKILYSIGAPAIVLFVIYATTSVAIKINLILNYSKAPFYSLVFFFSYFFILHDSTQIRASLAIALLFLALTYLANGRRLAFTLIVLATGITIHTSSIVFLVMLFMRGKNGTIAAVLAVLIGFIIYITQTESLLLISKISSAFSPLQETIIQNKLNIYTEEFRDVTTVNPFNIIAITAYIGIALTALQYKKFDAFERLSFNATILSIAIFMAFWDSTTIQLRISEIFAFGLVFTIPHIIKSINNLTLNTNPTAVKIGLILFFVFLYLYFAHYKQMVAL